MVFKTKSAVDTDGDPPEKDNPLVNQAGAAGVVGIDIGNAASGGEKSEINTGGKTSLTDTKIKAGAGASIKADGGTDRTTN